MGPPAWGRSHAERRKSPEMITTPPNFSGHSWNDHVFIQATIGVRFGRHLVSLLMDGP